MRSNVEDRLYDHSEKKTCYILRIGYNSEKEFYIEK